MTDDKSEQFQKNFYALLLMFNNRPSILLEYLIKYEALKSDFKDRILTNDKLSELVDQLESGDLKKIDKPIFNNLEQMQQYYNEVFQKKTKKKNSTVHSIKSEDEEFNLKKQLDESLLSEDYEKCAMLRDLINKKGYKI